MRNHWNIKRLNDHYFNAVKDGVATVQMKRWAAKMLEGFNNIDWTEQTFNAVWGCTKVSSGCKNCYAAVQVKRFGFSHDGSRPDLWVKSGETVSGKGFVVEDGRRTFGKTYWQKLHEWNRKAEDNNSVILVFVGNMNDMFEDHPVTRRELKKLWNVIRETPYIHYQFLTKRPENIRECLPEDWFEFDNGYPNVWLGTSIENQAVAFRFDKYLADLPAAVKYVSYEPAIGPLKDLRWDKLDWIIVGGESGHNHRPLDHQWARDVKELCSENDVSFFFKQDADRYTNRGKKLDEVKYYNFPLPRPSAPLQLEVAI